MNKSILILGGGSFLGQALAKELISKVTSLGLSFSSVATVPENTYTSTTSVHHHVLNLLDSDEQTVKDVINPYEIIVNCTGQISQPISACLDLNTRAIDKLVRSIKESNKKLIHISTVGVYGTADYIDESSDLNPETPYSTCKAFAEYLISQLEESQYCLVRLSNLYGQNQTKGLFSYLLKSANGDKKLTFNNNGVLLRYFLEVRDCAAILAKMIELDCRGIFNCVGPEKHTIQQLISLFEEELEVKYETTYQEAKPYDNILEISDQKLKDIVSPEYKHSVKDFLKQRHSIIQTSH